MADARTILLPSGRPTKALRVNVSADCVACAAIGKLQLAESAVLTPRSAMTDNDVARWCRGARISLVAVSLSLHCIPIAP